ncbi:hypothetical protein K431DRAFT_283477 [Polychaeton citri CBS 116435]|uniref:Uncharacterized protein n=1 Tax=Polychaeton citri CBS 116435 TaxID=1314669 RepID=A0A9P4UQL0_9PEZI|nr:hypothetical protein K431DRAFT_283477 [Polychaeton citri CBS 116435]
MHQHYDLEEKSLFIRSSSPRTRTSLSRPTHSTVSGLLLVTLFSLVLLGSTILGISRLDYRRQDQLQQLPTDFTRLHQLARVEYKELERILTHNNGTHIDERYIFIKSLGQGNGGYVS